MGKNHGAPYRQYWQVPPGVACGGGACFGYDLRATGSEYTSWIDHVVMLMNVIGPVLWYDCRARSARPTHRSVVVIHVKGNLLPLTCSRQEDALRLVADLSNKETSKLARS